HPWAASDLGKFRDRPMHDLVVEEVLEVHVRKRLLARVPIAQGRQRRRPAGVGEERFGGHRAHFSADLPVDAVSGDWQLTLGPSGRNTGCRYRPLLAIRYRSVVRTTPKP